MQIRELSIQEFEMFANNYPDNSIYQTIEYGYIMNNNNYDILLLGLVDTNNIIHAATLLLIDKGVFKYAYAPRGFLIDYTNYNLLETFTKLIKKYCNKKDIIAIKLSPNIVRFIYEGKNKLSNQNYDAIMNNLKKLNYFHFGYNHFFESLRPRFIAKVNIDKPYYEVFNNLKKNYRNKVRNAANKGVKIYRGNVENINYLFLNETSNPKDTKYYQDCFYFFKDKIELYYALLDTDAYLRHIKKKYEYYEQLSNEINQQMIAKKGNSSEKVLNKKLLVDRKFDKYKKDLVRATRLLREHPKGIIASAILIVKYKDEIFVIKDSYNKNIKDSNSKQLLTWKLLEKYSKLGFKKLNLGGMTELNFPNNKYEGLNKSKLSYNPNVYEYLGDLELVINQAKYFMYRQTSNLKDILKK